MIISLHPWIDTKVISSLNLASFDKIRVFFLSQSFWIFPTPDSFNTSANDFEFLDQGDEEFKVMVLLLFDGMLLLQPLSESGLDDKLLSSALESSVGAVAKLREDVMPLLLFSFVKVLEVNKTTQTRNRVRLPSQDFMTW